jgi:hypothetical protein
MKFSSNVRMRLTTIMLDPWGTAQAGFQEPVSELAARASGQWDLSPAPKAEAQKLKNESWSLFPTQWNGTAGSAWL